MSKTSAGAALILVALLLCYAGYTGTPAVAQDGVPPEGQYGLPAEDQYDSPPPTTAPLPEEDQYGAPPEDQNGGGTTGLVDEGTAPVEDGNNGDDDNGDDGAAENRTPDRPPPDAAGGNRSRIWDGFFVDAAVFLAGCSLITTVLFFVERREDRRG